MKIRIRYVPAKIAAAQFDDVKDEAEAERRLRKVVKVPMTIISIERIGKNKK
jgi:hypothetical protein